MLSMVMPQFEETYNNFKICKNILNELTQETQFEKIKLLPFI